MYLIGVILFVIFIIVLAVFDASAMAILDLPSLVVILALSFPMLMASGLLQDFFKGFKLMSQKENPYTIIELKRIKEACKLAVKSVLLSGVVGSLIGAVSVMANVSDPEVILPSMAVAALTTLYSMIIVALILPVQAKVMSVIGTLE